MKNGIELIKEERKRQIEELGFTLEYDLEHRRDGSLLQLANYLLFSNNERMPLGKGWTQDQINQYHLLPRIGQLAVVGALIAAEIDLRKALIEMEEKDEEI